MQRVLVVDDHPGTTETLSLLLRLLGHEPHAVQRGDDALRIAREIEPHLVLLDIGLPDMNGYDVARLLREQQGTHMVLAAATGWGRTIDRERAAEAGFDRHLVKPLDVGQIRELLELSATCAQRR